MVECNSVVLVIILCTWVTGAIWISDASYYSYFVKILPLTSKIPILLDSSLSSALTPSLPLLLYLLCKW
jgi:hypothetical protein